MTNPPTQRGGVTLPDDFAEVLIVLKRLRDPRLPATLAAAREAGWTLDVLGAAMGVVRERVRQIISKAAPGVGPIPGIPAPGAREAPSSRATIGHFADIARRAEDAARGRAYAAFAEAIIHSPFAETITSAVDDARERAEADRADQARIKEERAAERKFLDLCQRRFLKPLKDEVSPDDEGHRWYRCTKCRKKILRDAVNPYSHRCY